MRRLVGTFFVVVLVATLAPPVAAGARADCPPPVGIERWELSIRPERDSYDFGDTVRVTVRVRDKIAGGPAPAGVHTGLMIANNDRSNLFAIDKTDGRGRTFLDIELDRKALERGWVEAWAVAYRKTFDVELACVTVYEHGSRHRARAFKVG